MRSSLADLDLSQLTERERWVLENVLPRIEEGYKLEEIALERGRDVVELKHDLEHLAAHVTAISGRVDVRPHTDEEYESLKASIEIYEQRYPILRGSPTSGMPGAIVDGKGRMKACHELNRIPVVVDVDGTADELQCLGLVLNVARRHLDASSRRGLARVELLRDAARSDRAIAAAAGVSHKTVSALRRDLVAAGEIPHHEERVGADGVAQPAARAREPQPPPLERTVRVLVATELFEQYVGAWVNCQAFRLVERRPNVYELQVQLLNPKPASFADIERLRANAARFAAALDRDVDDVVDELLRNASEILGRAITTPDDLSLEEAEWAITRLSELAEMAADA